MVVTSASGNPEAIRYGIDGLVVPRGDIAGLGEAVGKLARDPSLVRAMGASGAAPVRASFSIESCAKRYEALYQGLLAGKPPAEAAESGCPHGGKAS